MNKIRLLNIVTVIFVRFLEWSIYRQTQAIHPEAKIKETGFYYN